MVTLPPIVIVFGGSIYFETRKILVDLNRVRRSAETAKYEISWNVTMACTWDVTFIYRSLHDVKLRYDKI